MFNSTVSERVLSIAICMIVASLFKYFEIWDVKLVAFLIGVAGYHIFDYLIWNYRVTKLKMEESDNQQT